MENEPSPSMIFYYFPLIKYHLIRLFFTIIAYTLNKSFLIQHPYHVYPSRISTPWNQTIHSFIPPPAMQEHLFKYHPPPPQTRHWPKPEEVLNKLSFNSPIARAITLQGNLSGPELHQGVMFLQGSHLIYIQAEHGRWPTRDNFISCTAINIHFDLTFRLFIPVELISRQGIIDESPHSPFTSPIPFVKISNGYARYKIAHP